jgi:hypothetical protein
MAPGDEGGILPQDGQGAPTLPTEDFENFKFDFNPDTSQGKIVMTIYGHKGASKTYGTFCICTGRIGGFIPTGRTLALSFDNKTKITKSQWFPNDNIEVHDGKKYYSKDPLIRTKSGYMTYKYLLGLLKHEEQKDKPDWVVIDGFTEVAEIFEMAMRYTNGLKPTQGFANRNIWKDRGAFIQAFHDAALRCARVGLIYTTYSDKDEIIQDGEIIARADVPKYVDVVMRETDVVLNVKKGKNKDGEIYYIVVESTKFKRYMGTNGEMLPLIEGITLQQGKTYNITDLAEKKPTIAKKSVSETTPQIIPATTVPTPTIPVAETPKVETASLIIEKPKEEPKPTPEPIVIPPNPKVEALKVTLPPVITDQQIATNISNI